MRRLFITILLVGALVGGLVLGGPALKRWLTHSISQAFTSPQCIVSAGGADYSLDPDQTANAALMAAIATQRGLPARAVTIAMATSMQESKLHNLSYGDADSLGLFQQQWSLKDHDGSPLWGTKEQVTNPQHATNAFYNALLRVPNWDKSLSSNAQQAAWIGRVAQAVQHSADVGGESYASHAPYARAFASALMGQAPHSLNCQIDTPKTADARAATAEVSGFYAAAVKAPATRGNTVTFPVRGNDQIGWAAAEYLVAQADRFGLIQVSYDGWSWTPEHAWRRSDAGSAGILAQFVN